MEDVELTNIIIGCAIKVHTQLGPGLLESAYEACFAHELTAGRLYVVRQQPMPLTYNNLEISNGYKADLVVERRVIVEVKSVKRLEPVHEAQLHTYLRLSGCRIGLLINFNVRWLKNGIKRIVID